MTMKQMAAVAVLAVAAGAYAQTSNPVKDDLFAGTDIFAKGASDVTEVSMDPDSLGMVSGKAGARAHTMVLNVVRTYEYDKPGMYRIEDVEVFRNKLNTGDWHCSVHTRSLKSGESTDVCNKRRSDDMVETAIITVEPKELTFIHTIRKRGAGENYSYGPGESYMMMPDLGELGRLPQMAMMNVQPQITAALSRLNAIDMSAMITESQALSAANMKSRMIFDSNNVQRYVEDARRSMSDAQRESADKQREAATKLKDKQKQPE